MAVKLADTLAPMGDFEIAQAKDVSVEIGGTTKMLQTAIDNGEIGGGGSSTFVGETLADWEALLPTEKAKYEFVDFTNDVDSALIDDTEAHTNKVYSSSKVENIVKDVYSTTEVETNKVWINGKPIYRKVVSISFGAKEYTKYIPYSSVCTVMANTLVYDFIGYKQYYNVAGTDFLRVWNDIDNSRFEVVRGTSYPAGAITFNIVIEYTKTTD